MHRNLLLASLLLAAGPVALAQDGNKYSLQQLRDHSGEVRCTVWSNGAISTQGEVTAAGFFATAGIQAAGTVQAESLAAVGSVTAASLSAVGKVESESVATKQLTADAATFATVAASGAVKAGSIAVVGAEGEGERGGFPVLIAEAMLRHVAGGEQQLGDLVHAVLSNAPGAADGQRTSEIVRSQRGEEERGCGPEVCTEVPG